MVEEGSCHRLVLLIAFVAFVGSLTSSGFVRTEVGARAAEPVGDSVPSGLWELAATHKAPFDMRLIEPLGKLLVVSNLTGQVAAIRPDSGLVADHTQGAVRGVAGRRDERRLAARDGRRRRRARGG